MFFRIHTDGTRTNAAHLIGQFAGTFPSACWILGGGPSLNELAAHIEGTPIPIFAVNLAGHGLLRPDFWTSYDPSARFHRSTYLNPAVMKFVHAGRAMDLVPETTHKVCDCPNTFTFDRRREAGFADFLKSGCCKQQGVTDWNDSLVQAIHIAYLLGFRRLYLAGCEMCVRPGATQIMQAAKQGVSYTDREPLKAFADRCYQAGITRERLADLNTEHQYHFDETKAFPAAATTDQHYYRIVQYLRLSRRAMSLAGLELISVTPGSRLNDHFRFQLITSAIRDIHKTVGDPADEQTNGRYTAERPQGQQLAPMQDLKPHNWPAKGRKPQPPQPPEPKPVAVEINEVG